VKLISSRGTFFIKYVSPVLAVCFLAVWSVMALRSGPVEEVWMFPMFAVAILAIWTFAYYRYLWTLADEVEDGGNFLRVRRRSEEQRVRFEDIINVAFERQQGGRRAVLRLARSGAFGDRIVFIPAMNFQLSLSMNPTNPIEEDLIRRVDAARRSAAA